MDVVAVRPLVGGELEIVRFFGSHRHDLVEGLVLGRHDGQLVHLVHVAANPEGVGDVDHDSGLLRGSWCH